MGCFQLLSFVSRPSRKAWELPRWMTVLLEGSALAAAQVVGKMAVEFPKERRGRRWGHANHVRMGASACPRKPLWPNGHTVPQVPYGSGLRPTFTFFACCDRTVSLWSYVLLAGQPQGHPLAPGPPDSLAVERVGVAVVMEMGWCWLILRRYGMSHTHAEVNNSCLSPDQSFSQSVIMIR